MVAVSAFLFIIAGIFMVVCAVVMVLVGRWVYKDAKIKGLPAPMWTAVSVLLPFLIGLLIYIVYRADKKPTMVCKSCERTIEMNVSFCPFCGYQSPPVEAVRVHAKAPKGLVLLILIPAFLIFFSIIGVIGMVFMSSNVSSRNYTMAESGYASASNSIEFSYPEEYYAGATQISEYETFPSYSYNYENDNDWVNESYSDGYYSYNRSVLNENLDLQYDIPSSAKKIIISFYCTGRAGLLISPEPSIKAESYSTQYGNNQTNITAVYSIDAFPSSQKSLNFSIELKDGAKLNDVNFYVNYEY